MVRLEETVEESTKRIENKCQDLLSNLILICIVWNMWDKIFSINVFIYDLFHIFFIIFRERIKCMLM